MLASVSQGCHLCRASTSCSNSELDSISNTLVFQCAQFDTLMFDSVHLHSCYMRCDRTEDFVFLFWFWKFTKILQRHLFVDIAWDGDRKSVICRIQGSLYGAHKRYPFVSVPYFYRLEYCVLFNHCILFLVHFPFILLCLVTTSLVDVVILLYISRRFALHSSIPYRALHPCILLLS